MTCPKPTKPHILYEHRSFVAKASVYHAMLGQSFSSTKSWLLGGEREQGSDWTCLGHQVTQREDGNND